LHPYTQALTPEDEQYNPGPIATSIQVPDPAHLIDRVDSTYISNALASMDIGQVEFAQVIPIANDIPILPPDIQIIDGNAEQQLIIEGNEAIVLPAQELIDGIALQNIAQLNIAQQQNIAAEMQPITGIEGGQEPGP